MGSWKRTFIAAWTAQMISITGFSAVLPFLPFYIRELGVTNDADVMRWAGIVTTAAAATLALFGPVWGMLADRFGRKPMVLRAMFGGAVALLLMAFCQNVHQLVLCRLFQGALTGTVTANLALVASVTPRERAGFALGMMQAAVFVGASLGPLLGGVVADHWGYRAAFYAAAALLVVGGALVKLCVQERFEGRKPGEAAPHGTFGQVFAASGFLAAVFVLFVIRFADSLARPVFPLLIEQIRGNSVGINTVTGSIMAVGGLAAACSAGFLGWFSDAWGHRRMLVGFSLITGAVSGLYVFAQTVGHLFVLRFLFGLGAAGMMPAANAIIRRVTADENIGKAYGVTSSIAAVGWSLGPLTGGYVGASLGLRAPFVCMAAAMGLVPIVVLAFLREERGVAGPAQGDE